MQQLEIFIDLSWWFNIFSNIEALLFQNIFMEGANHNVLI